MNKELESLIEKFTFYAPEYMQEVIYLDDFNNHIKPLIEEIQKEKNLKDKIIYEAAKMINNHDIDEDVCKKVSNNILCKEFETSEENCIKCIINFLERKEVIKLCL